MTLPFTAVHTATVLWCDHWNWFLYPNTISTNEATQQANSFKLQNTLNFDRIRDSTPRVTRDELTRT